MMKTILKQSFLGLVMAGIGLAAGVSLAQLQVPKIEDTQSWKDALDIADSLKEKGGVNPKDISISSTSSAYKEVSDAIDNVTSGFTKLDQDLKSQADEFTAGFRGNIKSPNLGDIAGDIGEDALQKAQDLITGKELMRLMDPAVLAALDQQKQQAGAGLPTTDYANMTVGIFNLNSVFGVYDKNLTIQTKDTRMCVIMGGDPVKCCEQWTAESMGTKLLSAMPKGLSPQMACCMLDTNMCLSVAQEKAGCLVKQQGLNLEAGFKACAVECKQDYVALSQQVLGQNATGEAIQKFDPSKVEELVKACYDTTQKAADPTVLTSDELAPVVPEPVQKLLSAEQTAANGLSGALTEATKQMGDVKSGIDQSVSGAVNGLNQAMSGIRGQVEQTANGAIDRLGGVTNNVLNQTDKAASELVNGVDNTIHSATQAALGNGQTK